LRWASDNLLRVVHTNWLRFWPALCLGGWRRLTSGGADELVKAVAGDLLERPGEDLMVFFEYDDKGADFFIAKHISGLGDADLFLL
jgi:hypothetical protein